MENVVIGKSEKRKLSVKEVALTSILLSAGAILKFVVGTFINFGMKPNFIIAMYCLVIILIKPRLRTAIVIGIASGLICQLFPGQPLINIGSELVGAVVITLIAYIKVFENKKIEKFVLPLGGTFIATLCSGFTFVFLMYIIYFSFGSNSVTPLMIFLPIVFGTALINSLIVFMLYLPLKKFLKI